jgi:Double-GTPase 2
VVTDIPGDEDEPGPVLPEPLPAPRASPLSSRPLALPPAGGGAGSAPALPAGESDAALTMEIPAVRAGWDRPVDAQAVNDAPGSPADSSREGQTSRSGEENTGEDPAPSATMTVQPWSGAMASTGPPTRPADPTEQTAAAQSRGVRTTQPGTTTGPLPAEEARKKRIHGSGPPGETVVCPVCLSDIDWANAPLVKRYPDGAEENLPRVSGSGQDGPKARLDLMSAEVVCTKTAVEHFLPEDYGGLTKLMVGFVGQQGTGKTLLLTAMAYTLLSSNLDISYRLSVTPLNIQLNREFEKDYVQPFIDERKTLGRTLRRERARFVCAFRLHDHKTNKEYALVFFDVAGEAFNEGAVDETKFMGLVNGLIFVADGSELATRPDRRQRTGPAFVYPIEQIRAMQVGKKKQRFWLPPSVLVIAKADLLRDEGLSRQVGSRAIVDDWLSRNDERRIADLSTVEEESLDGYVFLQRRRGEKWLLPFVRARDSTIHFSSATGVDLPVGQRVFPANGFGAQRVLRPLLTLLVMQGALGGADADAILGRHRIRSTGAGR